MSFTPLQELCCDDSLSPHAASLISVNYFPHFTQNNVLHTCVCVQVGRVKPWKVRGHSLTVRLTKPHLNLWLRAKAAEEHVSFASVSRVHWRADRDSSSDTLSREGHQRGQAWYPVCLGWTVSCCHHISAWFEGSKPALCLVYAMNISCVTSSYYVMSNEFDNNNKFQVCRNVTVLTCMYSFRICLMSSIFHFGYWLP